jgi:putative DeoR family transcriptional regulator (stage III sporulation protein D)
MRNIIRRLANLKDYIEERVLDVARYIIESKSTIRKTARQFGVSKSTVHKDVTERLPKINPQIAKEAKGILDLNKSERHIRGGKATKLKYKIANN